MDDPPHWARVLQRNGLVALARMLGSASPGATTYESDGVVASIVPNAPTEPDGNFVAFGSTDRLAAALPDIRAAYSEAGIEHWGVMVPDDNADAARLLAASGHRRTVRLPAMTVALADFKPIALRGLDYDAHGDMSTLGRVNAAAYARPALAGLFVNRPAAVDPRVYQARVGGEPAAVLCTIDLLSDRGLDCAGYFVATDPNARHVGLAPRLLSAALMDARERGCLTCSGQASPMGARIYSRMGLRTMFHYDRYDT